MMTWTDEIVKHVVTGQSEVRDVCYLSEDELPTDITMSDMLQKKENGISIKITISNFICGYTLVPTRDEIFVAYVGRYVLFYNKRTNYYQSCSIMIVDVQSKITCRINMNMDKKLERFKTKMYPYLKAEVVLRLHRHFFMEDIDFTNDI